MSTRTRSDLAGWVIPVVALVVVLPVVLGRTFGLDVDVRQQAMASLVAALAVAGLLEG